MCSSAEVNMLFLSDKSISARAHQSFPKSDPSPCRPAQPTSSLFQFRFHWVWWQMTEWRREYFDILLHCSRFGVVVLLASSNMFCVACSFTGFHITFFCLSTLPLQPKDWTKGCTNYHLGILVVHTDQRDRFIGGLSGPTVMWSSPECKHNKGFCLHPLSWDVSMMLWISGYHCQLILRPTVLWMLLHSLLPGSELSI